MPDASKCSVAILREINNFEIVDSACWNIKLWAVLYQRAWINMMTPSGPLAISSIMEQVRTIIIDPSLDYPDDYLDGIIVGGVFSGSTQNFIAIPAASIWGNDNKEKILKLFNEFAELSCYFTVDQSV